MRIIQSVCSLFEDNEGDNDSTIEDSNIGITEQRSCTDLFCIVFYIVLVIAWVAMGCVVVLVPNNESDTPSNLNNQPCEYDGAPQKKPNLFFLDVSRCGAGLNMTFSCKTPKICLTKCPSENFYYKHYLHNMKALRKRIICIPSVNKSLIMNHSLQYLIDDQQCTSYYFESKPVGNRCVPILPPFQTEDVEIFIGEKRFVVENVNSISLQAGARIVKVLSTAAEFWILAVTELSEFWLWIIFWLLIFGLISLIYIFLIQLIPRVMVWFSLSACIFMILTSDGRFSYKSLIIPSSDGIRSASHECEGILKFILFLIKGTCFTLLFIDLLYWYCIAVAYFSIKKYISDEVERSTLIKNNQAELIDKFGPDFVNALEARDTMSYFGNFIWLIAFFILFILLVILLSVTLFLRSHIVLATALISEGSKMIKEIPSSLFLPIFLFFFHIIVLTFVISVSIGLIKSRTAISRVEFLSNDPRCKCNKVFQDEWICSPEEFIKSCKYENGEQCKRASCNFAEKINTPTSHTLSIFNGIVFILSLFFFTYLEDLTLSLIFATYFFTREKSEVPFYIVITSFWKICRYHSGTAVAGAICFPLLGWIKELVEVVHVRIQESETCQSCVFCQVIMWYLHKGFRHITKQSFIMCAMHGQNFIESAKLAVSVGKTNYRLNLIEKVTHFIFFSMKMAITTAAGLSAFTLLSNHISKGIFLTNDFKPQIVPTVYVVAATYFMTSLCFNVYAMAVNTVLLCALEDSEINDGSPSKPYFMSKNLMRIMGVISR